MKTADEILSVKIPHSIIVGGETTYKKNVAIEACHEFADQFKSWIKVSDQLPTIPKKEKFFEVVVYDEDTHEQWLAFYTKDCFWIIKDSDYDRTLKNVTHWHYKLSNPKN